MYILLFLSIRGTWVFVSCSEYFKRVYLLKMDLYNTHYIFYDKQAHFLSM